ncbi:MAG: LysR substrate-binding domain-containing protein, partial [Cyanobacteria bacterium P01_E01_bin.34]
MQQATLRQLKVFEAVARHRSFTRAAEELYLTQPTVSMQMKQLAKTAGTPLFELIGKRLYLTEAGTELYSTCKQIFDLLERFEMKVSDLQGMKQGRLRLAVITTAKYVAPRLLGTFCQRYPGIDVSLEVTNHEGLLERIVENADDLYILSRPPKHLDIHCQPFLENPLVVMAPSNHPLAQQPEVSLEALAEEPFIMREPGSATREAVERLFQERDLAVKVRMSLGSNEAIKQAIAGGLGLSVLSRHTLALMGATTEIAELNVQHFPIALQWNVV